MLTEQVTHFCPYCGKRVEYPYGATCTACGKAIPHSVFEDFLIFVINKIWLTSLKTKCIGALLFYFFFPGTNSPAGQAICLSLIAVVGAGACFTMLHTERASLFWWSLKNDYRDKKIISQSSFYTGYSTASEQYIMSLTPRQFENYIADIFRNLDYDVTLTPSTADGGKDLILKKAGVTYYVECKQWEQDSSIGRPVLQKLIGAAVSDGVTHVIFVTTCKYAKTAIDAAAENRMVNVDLWGMKDIIAAAEKGKRVPPLAHFIDNTKDGR